MFSCEFCEISKNTFPYRTPLGDCFYRKVKLRLLANNASLRSSRRELFSVRKGVLKNFTKFMGKHLCLVLFFNKVAGLRPAAVLKNRLWHRCFPVNFVKFLRTPFLQNNSGRLLLKFEFSPDNHRL